MPSFRTITIGLCSQFDVANLPEYPPPEKDGLPKLQDHDVVSVYVPILPGSQFWISYAVDDPAPRNAYFYFKLLINGAPIVSWGTGKKDNFRGKTMFAMYDATEKWSERQTRTEKRGMFFAAQRQQGEDPSVAHHRHLEIRVYRAKGRKRIPKDLDHYQDTVHGRKKRDGIELVSVGQAKKEQPRRFYKYALADPIDKPFATFKYYYKKWNELEELGALESTTASDESGMSVVWHESMENVQGEEEGESQDAKDSETKRDIVSALKPDEHYHEREDIEEDNFGFIDTVKRLSIPPSRKLFPTTNSSFSTPRTLEALENVKPVVEPLHGDAWLRRTPSPVKGGFRDIDSPTPGRKRSHPSEILRDVVVNALRRRPSGDKVDPGNTDG